MKFFKQKTPEPEAPVEIGIDMLDEEGARHDGKDIPVPTKEPGASEIKAAQALWGRTGRWLIIAG